MAVIDICGQPAVVMQCTCGAFSSCKHACLRRGNMYGMD